MRAKQQKHNHKGLLRRAIAVGMAAAMIYSTALSCSALETMEVVDDATGLVKEVPLTAIDEDTPDEDGTLDLVEDELPPDDTEDADEAQDDAEEPDAADEKEEPEETLDESDEEDSKEEDDSKDEISSDDETADDEDFIDIGMLDEDEGKIAVLNNSVGVAYYYKDSTTNKQGFYQNNGHDTLVSGTNANTTMQDFISNYCAPDATIYMDSGYHVSNDEEWTPTSHVTLNYRGTGRVLYVDNGGTLTLGGSLIVDGGGQEKALTAIEVCNGGTLKIKDNVVVENCKASGNAGAIYVSGGSLEMEGGTLSNNEATGYAGCVWVDGGTFKMTGGTITWNKCGTYGGGVYLSGTNGKFEMSSGTISDNGAQHGGGVYIESGTFEMTGGIIGDETSTNKGNNSVNGGGGVYVNGGTFKMSENAVISNNTSSGSGGGVYVNSTFEMSGGKISGNQLDTSVKGIYGGAVATVGDFTMKGGLITGNKASRTTAVSVMGGTFTVEGGTVVDNQIDTTDNSNYGSAVNKAGKIEITGGSIDVIHNRESTTGAITKDGTIEVTGTGFAIGGFAPGTQYSMDIEYIYNGVKCKYPCDNVYADDKGYIYPWLPEGSKLNGGTGDFPQISLTVPLSLTVNVSPTGDCVVTASGTDNVTIGNVPIVTYVAESTNSKIKNNSAVPVYLTEVTFTWNTDGGQTDDGKETPAPSAIFTNWSKKPSIKLGNDFGTETGNTITWKPKSEIPANGELGLDWSFELNGNSISQALQADTLAPIGTIVYTVSYQDPNVTGSAA